MVVPPGLEPGSNLYERSALTFMLQDHLVGEDGLEPTQSHDNGFTDRPSSPTLALTH